MKKKNVLGWDRKFMGLAEHLAGWTKGVGRKVGAVIIGPDNEIRASGFNGLPRGVNDEVKDRHNRETGEKYHWWICAEANAICNAARIGVSLKGCRIYTSTLYPCANCARLIIQSGITEVIAEAPDFADAQWGASFRRAQIMFREAKVKVRFLQSPARTRSRI